jgi:histone H3/H4
MSKQEMIERFENKGKIPFNYNIRLHYAPLGLKGDIPFFDFDNVDDFEDYLEILNQNQKQEKVYIIAIDELLEFLIEDSVVVTESANKILVEVGFIVEMINCYPEDQEHDLPFHHFERIVNVYLQEYRTYRQAYKVALSMQEHKYLY